jgi:hypothetical protein
MNMNVIIRITGGSYEGKSWTGALAAAPVTFLVPEGIVSARTTAEADRVRNSIANALATNDRVTMTAVGWSISAERAAD